MISRILNIPKTILKKIDLLFLWSSGIHLEIIEKTPHEKSKYFGIGGTIIFTALMASLAGGYAFFTAFKSINLSIFFGIFWGALIFNLDRYIVSTFGVGDGKKTISLQEIKEALPRIVMAVILGIVIATPLELKIFEKEIEVEIEKMKDENYQKLVQADTIFFQDKADQEKLVTTNKNELEQLKRHLEKAQKAPPDYITIQINELEEECKRLYTDYKEKQISKNKAQRNLYYARQNEDNYSKKELKRYLMLFSIATTNFNNSDNTYKEANSRLNNLKSKGNKFIEEGIKKTKEDIIKKEAELEKEEKTLDLLRIEEKTKKRQKSDVAKRYDGFAAHLEAMDRLTKNNAKLNAASWLITLLFIFIEIAPILFKMMTERGSYDDYLDRVKYDILVRQRQKQSDLNDEVNMQVKAHSEKMEQQLNAEIAANEELLRKIADAQAEITELAIQEWKKKKLEEIKKDPSKVIKSF